MLCVNEDECVLVDDGCERGVGAGDRPANAVRRQQVSICFCVAVLFETNAHLISGDLCLYVYVQRCFLSDVVCAHATKCHCVWLVLLP